MNIELNVSYNVLKKIYNQKAFSQIELNDALINSKCNHALVTKIVYGVLENDILLEYFLKQFYSKKPRNEILILLKIGAYVSHFLNSIPPFALVNELVNISKRVDFHVSGFVNATLKHIVATQITYPEITNQVQYLSVKFSYPEWIIKMFINELGYDFTLNMLSYKPTTLTHIRINPDVTNKDAFEQELKNNNITYEQSQVNNAFYVDYEQLLNNEKLVNAYVVIGTTSMNLVDCIKVPEGANIFDACASPGGKSLYLSQMHPSVSIIAGDIYSHRVALIQSLIDKYKVTNIKPIVNDATKLNKDFVNAFDAVLCDVPCSGLGVISKKPDIMLNRKAEDIKTLSKLQTDIVNVCCQYVKDGGELYYSTCTLLKQENQNIINEFLKTHPNFCLTKIDEPNKINAVSDNNMLTYYPHLSHTEGFFIARLTKKGVNNN